MNGDRMLMPPVRQECECKELLEVGKDGEG